MCGYFSTKHSCISKYPCEESDIQLCRLLRLNMITFPFNINNLFPLKHTLVIPQYPKETMLVVWLLCLTQKRGLSGRCGTSGIFLPALQCLSVTSPFSSSQELLSNDPCYWDKDESWLPIDPQDLSGSSWWIYVKLPFYSPLATSVLFLLELACQNNRVLNSTKTRDFLLGKPGRKSWGNW